jgi:hypothetical protein
MVRPRSGRLARRLLAPAPTGNDISLKLAKLHKTKRAFTGTHMALRHKGLPFYKAGHARHALSAVVRVSNGGRGFVVETSGRFGRRNRYVITAAHCLPRVPPRHGLSHTEERTYKKLLAPLGKKPSVWCECLFLDPIADIAVLGGPDNQELSEQAAPSMRHWSKRQHRSRSPSRRANRLMTMPVQELPSTLSLPIDDQGNCSTSTSSRWVSTPKTKRAATEVVAMAASLINGSSCPGFQIERSAQAFPGRA